MLWPVGLAAVVRLGAWAIFPPARAATDELGYWAAATDALAGRQDTFWPPLTAWLVALLRVALHTDAIAIIRLAWIAMSVASALVLRVIALRIGRMFLGDEGDAARRFARNVTVAFALYLPSIVHAQTLTSETPASLLLLTIVMLTTGSSPGLARRLATGALLGLLALARTSTLPLLLAWPVGAVVAQPSASRREAMRRVALSTAVGALVFIAGAAAQHRSESRVALPDNGAYDLYIGNREVYVEDLDLLHPRATPEQIALRRRFWQGERIHEALDREGYQRAALRSIVDHPGRFVRRMVGRAARMFAPKTDVLELGGGEQAFGIFSARALALLVVANAQWVVVLFAGVFGLLAVRGRDRSTWCTLAACFAGVVPASLVAISKPRYAFVLEPLLLLGAAILLTAPRARWHSLAPRERAAGVAIAAFLAWGWAAWAVFAWTSRAP